MANQSILSICADHGVQARVDVGRVLVLEVYSVVVGDLVTAGEQWLDATEWTRGRREKHFAAH